MSGRLRYALWLDPDPDGLEPYREAMAQLRAQLGGPLLPPHLTLTSGIIGDEGEILRAFSDWVAGVAPWITRPLPRALAVRAGTPLRAVTVDVDAPAPAVALRARVRAAVGLDPDEPWSPHLSLAYAELDDAGAEALHARWVAVPWPPIRIVGCTLWRLEGGIEGWRPLAPARFQCRALPPV